jgi:hypothetical protein
MICFFPAHPKDLNGINMYHQQPIEHKPDSIDLTNPAQPWKVDKRFKAIEDFLLGYPSILYRFVRHIRVHPIYHFEGSHPMDSSFLVKSPAEVYKAIYDFETYFEGLGGEELGFHIDKEAGSDNGFFPLNEEDKERVKWTSEYVPLFKGFFVEVALNHEMEYLEAAMPELHGIHWTCNHEIKASNGETTYVKQFQVYDWAKSEEAIADVLKGIYKCMLNELQ